MGVETYTEEDLRALVTRTASTLPVYSEQIGAVVEEVLAARKVVRNEARRDIMLMAASVATEVIKLSDMTTPEGRAYIAEHAVALAIAIEKATPR